MGDTASHHVPRVCSGSHNYSSIELWNSQGTTYGRHIAESVPCVGSCQGRSCRFLHCRSTSTESPQSRCHPNVCLDINEARTHSRGSLQTPEGRCWHPDLPCSTAAGCTGSGREGRQKMPAVLSKCPETSEQSVISTWFFLRMSS